jgi:hypothetical protein
MQQAGVINLPVKQQEQVLALRRYIAAFAFIIAVRTLRLSMLQANLDNTMSFLPNLHLHPADRVSPVVALRHLNLPSPLGDWCDSPWSLLLQRIC